MTITWGSTADWANVLVTACALVAAIVAARTAIRAYRLEQRRQTDLDERNTASQAALVAAWITSQPPGPWDAVLRNGSNLPIYDVAVTMDSHEATDLGPALQQFAVVAPGDHTLPYPRDYTWAAPPVETHLIYDLRLTITFVDAAGNTWHRDERGRLHPTKRRA